MSQVAVAWRLRHRSVLGTPQEGDVIGCAIDQADYPVQVYFYKGSSLVHQMIGAPAQTGNRRARSRANSGATSSSVSAITTHLSNSQTCEGRSRLAEDASAAARGAAAPPLAEWWTRGSSVCTSAPAANKKRRR